MLIPFYMKAYCVVNTKACPGASVLGPGALGALKSLLESGVAGAQNKQNIYIYIDREIYIYREIYKDAPLHVPAPSVRR